MFNECKKYLADIGESRPLYAGISIQIESIADEMSPIRLVNHYTRIQADGYLLMFDAKLDTFNKAHYYAFGKIVSMLGDVYKPIVLSRVNDFGLGLMSLGATAISSGIGFIEDFHESILIEEGGGYYLKPRYYIPQLLTSYSDKALKSIFEPAIGKQLACDCPYCQGSTDANFLSNPRVSKGHYLFQKQKQVALLAEMERPERLRWFNQKVEEASNLAKQLRKATNSRDITYDHFQYWIDSINQIERERKSIIRSISPS